MVCFFLPCFIVSCHFKYLVTFYCLPNTGFAKLFLEITLNIEYVILLQKGFKINFGGQLGELAT